MAYGRPVVTVPYGGPEYEIVKDGVNGFIVSENNIDELVKAIEDIISDSDLEHKMGINAQNYILEEINLENMIDNIIKSRMETGELDDSPLTFKDISKIRDAFLNILVGQRHKRIRYPDQEKIEKGTETRLKREEEKDG